MNECLYFFVKKKKKKKCQKCKKKKIKKKVIFSFSTSLVRGVTVCAREV